MFGAIIGDIIGSPWEFESNGKTTEFPLFSEKSHFTDDSVMTAALARTLLDVGDDPEVFARTFVENMQRFGRAYPNLSYGGNFSRWLQDPDPQPYGSFGNGSAMRVSPVGWFYPAEESYREKVIDLARRSAIVTHNHPFGIDGAVATALAIHMARERQSSDAIRKHLSESDALLHPYRFDESVAEIREHYRFDVTCQGSVPQALQCFFEAEVFEDTVRLAVSLGGDADTQAAIAGSVAGARNGIPIEIDVDAYDVIDRQDAPGLLKQTIMDWDGQGFDRE